MAQHQHPQSQPAAAGGGGDPAGPVLRPAHLLPLQGRLHDGPVPVQAGQAAHVHQAPHAVWAACQRQDHAGVLQAGGIQHTRCRQGEF